MSQPSYAPIEPVSKLRHVPDLNTPKRISFNRPGELRGANKGLPKYILASPGPDSGYALKLVRHIRREIKHTEKEDIKDIETLIGTLSMRRASILGRAPILDDVRLAANIFKYFQEPSSLDASFVEQRENLIKGIAHSSEKREWLASQLNESLLEGRKQIELPSFLKKLAGNL